VDNPHTNVLRATASPKSVAGYIPGHKVVMEMGLRARSSAGLDRGRRHFARGPTKAI